MSDKLLQVEHLKQYFPAGGMGKTVSSFRPWMMSAFL